MVSHPSRHHRVGIIGAGIAGSSAAYFLRQELGADVEILVFEHAAHVGGRVHEREVAGVMVELGASIFHSSNRYLTHFVEMLGLHQQPSDATETFGIWNGTSFDFTSSPSALFTRVKMLRRYGLTPLHLQRATQDMVKRLIQVYASQDQGQGFSTPEDLFTALGLYALTQQSSYDYFRASGTSERFLTEFMNGASRNNYGQDASLNAFANLVSLAGAGMAGGYLCSVREGNSQMCQGLLRVSDATVRTECRVRDITRVSDANEEGWMLLLDGGETQRCDVVIIATPLESAEILIRESTLPATAQLRRSYQITHVTLVEGSVQPTYFGGKTRRDIPDFILTRENAAIPFSSLEIVGNKDHPTHPLYKLFSREPVADEVLNDLFVERRHVERWQWQAYPVLTPVSSWPPFQLGKELYYTNAMESAVSTMETEVMASRNVVNLLKQDQKKHEIASPSGESRSNTSTGL